jgi:hypothetical protein
MTNMTEGPRAFVEKAASDTREYVHSLLDENRRLGRLVSELETALSQRESMEALLKSRVAAIEEESRTFSERFVEVEQQNANLANLYVASYQLNGTFDRARVVAAIQEIVINLIGSEELAIWEVDDHTGVLTLAGSFGIEDDYWRTIPVGSGIIGSAVLAGQRYVACQPGESPREDAPLTACIPLKLDDRVIGAIGIFRMLPQKPVLEAVDFELFDLLASHAASALVCSRLAVQSVPVEIY